MNNHKPIFPNEMRIILIVVIIVLVILLLSFGKSFFFPTPVTPPPSYTIIADFLPDEDIDPVLQPEISSRCSVEKRDEILWFQCDNDSQEITYLRYSPRKNDQFHGIAMLAHVDQPYNETWGKIQLMMHFLAPGDSNERIYTLSLRKGIIHATEYYPANDWDSVSLAQKEIAPDQQTKFHLLQIEFQDGFPQFIVDGELLELQIPPNMPPNADLPYSWKFETVLSKNSDHHTLKGQIDWFAVLP